MSLVELAQRPQDIVGIGEIAERTRNTSQTVSNWTVRYSGVFPEPDFRLKMGPIYDWQKVLKWLHATGRV